MHNPMHRARSAFAANSQISIPIDKNLIAPHDSRRVVDAYSQYQTIDGFAGTSSRS
jgi:hypothetical protein